MEGEPSRPSNDQLNAQHHGIGYWLREREFYAIGIFYMCTRLVVNLSQAYMPLFLTETLRMETNAIAQATPNPKPPGTSLLCDTLASTQLHRSAIHCLLSLMPKTPPPRL